MTQSKRAARYDINDVRGQVERITAAGSEVGLHGIDAWRESAGGREEGGRIVQATGRDGIGVRMHWLYFDEQSPHKLEEAGFDYDSTFGYNETVGYRAGTTQAFKPLAASSLIELPLHAMDTALFYPGYLNLSPREAQKRLAELIDNAIQFGGVLTINWHDRSIAPERLWDGFYIRLLENLKARSAWFPTAARAVSWFRKRRAAVLVTGR